MNRMLSTAAGIALLAGILTGLLFDTAFTRQKSHAPKEPLPKAVLDGLNARFPKAKIDTWTKEKEGEILIYDIEFRMSGHKFEADIKSDGSIHNWEKAIASEELPDAVRHTVERKYPKGSMKEIMQITEMRDGKEHLEGYEIVLKTADKKETEITVAPDGTILEEPSHKDSTDKEAHH